MKIIKFQAERIKRLVAVEITPDGALINLTGKNRQGKSSILDAIFWAIDGGAAIQDEPVNSDAPVEKDGSQVAFVSLELGDDKTTLKVTRRFRQREGQKYTSTLTVENSDGARFASPQKILDGLIGALSFNPIEFLDMKPQEQFDLCRAFVPDFDFAATDVANKKDYADRTVENRQADTYKKQAEGVDIPTFVPEPVDEQAILDELEKAGQHNTAIRVEQMERDKQAAVLNEGREEIKKLEDHIVSSDAEVARLRAEIERLTENIRVTRSMVDAKKEALTDAEAKHNALPAIAEPIESGPIRVRLNEAKATNEIVKQAAAAQARRAELLEAAAVHEKRSADLTAAMEARTAAQNKAIASADLPVQGLGFGDKRITLNGHPFEQASHAEQLSASIAIAAALNPKLRVIRVPDGSKLDTDAMHQLAGFAETHNMQVWIETVESDLPGAIVIEDGMVKKEEEPGDERGGTAGSGDVAAQ